MNKITAKKKKSMEFLNSSEYLKIVAHKELDNVTSKELSR